MNIYQTLKPSVQAVKKALLLSTLPLALLVGGCTQPSVNPQAEVASQESQPDHLNTSLPLSTRVKALVDSMTLEEKVAQMYNDAPAIERLGVPAYDYWNEALHGVARAGEATVFPQAIGMAAMWDKAFLKDIATAISDEGRAKHHEFKRNGITQRYAGLTYWSPNINIFRDPRWGRGQETYGEDPFLTGELGVSFIQGLQGDDETYLKTAATAKHFAVHNGPEITRHSDNYVVSDKDLYETYLPAFEKAVVKADVEAVMCAYNRVNGLPACGSDMLLKEILRGQYNFDGHVMSDCGAIADFYDPKAHDVTRSPAAAAAWAVSSGTDLNCGTGRLSSFANLSFAVQKGFIDEALIDQAVERLFMTRFKLGMFDPDSSVPYSSISMEHVGSDKHQSMTELASAKSLVLLKNNGILPLKQDVKVAVIGPNGDNLDVLLGNYNGLPVNPVTVADGLSHYLGEEHVEYAPGSALIADIYGHWEVLDKQVLFHQDKEGNRVPGAQVNYYAVEREDMRDYRHPQFPSKLKGEAVAQDTLDGLTVRQMRSPVSGKLLDDYGMVINADLVPKQSGDYLFDGKGEITLDGEVVDGPVSLQAGQAYRLKVEHIFATDPVTNTADNLLREWQLRWVNQKTDLLSEAQQVAENADVIVMAVGISPRIEGEEMPVKLEGFDYGDRSSIALPAEQQALIKAMHKLGKPIVLVNFSGSAMALNWENEHADAIIQAFYPGEATGSALAKVLWGEISPSGRLPVTFYRDLAGFAAFDDYAMTNRTYRYFEGDVLYPFGYGLGYSEMQYSELEVPEQLVAGRDLTVSVTLKNSGDFQAEQVTQLYVRMPDAPVKTPNVSLKGFTRTALSQGEVAKVTLNVPAAELVYIDNDGNKVPYTGRLHVYVGNGQPDYNDGAHITHATVIVKK